MPREHGQRRRGAVAIAIGTEAASGHRVSRSDWLGRMAARAWGALLLEVDRRRLFLWLPVFYAIGIALYFAADVEPSLYASAIPLAFLAGASWFGRKRLAVAAPLLVVTMLFAGYFVATWRSISVAAPILAGPASAEIAGVVESVEKTGYGGRLVVAVTRMDPAPKAVPARIRVTVRGNVRFSSGDAVQFKARLTPPSPPAVPGGFDFQREAYFQRLGAVGLVTGAISAGDVAAEQSAMLRLRATIDRARNALTDRIVSVIGGSTGAIAAALVTGKRGEIAQSDNDNWRAAGIFHIISISGLHMMLAAGLFFWSARVLMALSPHFAARHPTKKYAAVVAMLGAIAYDVFSGSDVATERSLIMTLIMLGAILVDRPALAMRNLAIAGLVVLTLRPEQLLGPSFQMSFSAVAGLVAYGELLRTLRERAVIAAHGHDDGLIRKWGRIALDFSATSLIAGLATAPFQAYHFHKLNPYGLLGNTLAIPICSIIVMPAALAGVVLYPLGLDTPAWWIMGQGVSLISAAAALVAQLSGSIADVGRYGLLAMVLIALGITIMTAMSTLMFRALGLAVALAGFGMSLRQIKPAIILDANGRSALARGADGRLIFLGKTRPAFSLQQWLSGDRDSRGARDPTLAAGSHCDKLGCTARFPGGTLALVLDPAAFADDCERATIIVTPLRAPDHCWQSAEVYDRGYFAIAGATYIYPQRPGQSHETARHARLQRPWIPVRPAIPSAKTVAETPVPRMRETRRNESPWDPMAPDPNEDQ